MKKIIFLLGLLIVKPIFEGEAAMLKVEQFSTRFSRPVFVCAPPGDTNRLFVLEQHTGRIRILDLATKTVKPDDFLQISGLTTADEQGLLGLAFHPNYAETGYFYVNYTTTGGGAAGHTEITRYKVQGDPASSDMADPASKKRPPTYDQPENNHNGGWIAFGPDSYLYIATGDGGGGYDRHGTGNGQSRTTLLGKILRIDVDGGDPYVIPDGNPYKDQPDYRQEIWAFGLRNPWRCSFDRETGDLWIGDVGQDRQEEIDLMPAGSSGLNFGWRAREGSIQTSIYPNEQPVTAATEPILTYTRLNGGFCVIGGYVYRGKAIPRFQGSYIFADYRSHRVWSATNNGTVWIKTEFTGIGNPFFNNSYTTSFGEDAAGELYICSLGGFIYKIANGDVPPPQISDLRLNTDASEFTFTFEAVAGQGYVLDTRDSLSPTSPWIFIRGLVGPNSTTTNSIITVTNTVTGTQKYFRVDAP